MLLYYLLVQEIEMNSELVQHSLVYGVILTVVMSITCFTLMVLNPEVWVGDYPPDIKEKFGPMSAQAQKLKKVAGILVLLLIFGIVGGAMVHWAGRHAEPMTFMEAFLSSFLILTLFNVVDWLILDWLFFVTIQPRLIVLPGTEGMAGYKDYAFHFYGFLKGVIGSAAVSVVVGGVVLWMQTAV
jgi:hypothetical protein